MQIQSQRIRTLLIVTVFSLAGYISAQAFTSYSSWLDGQVEVLHDKYNRYEATYGNTPEIRNRFYDEQAAMDVYVVRKWTILYLEFPVALTVAFFLARLAGWLGHISVAQGVAGLGLVYIMPAPAIYLSGATWFLLTIPCLVVLAFGLTASLKIITSKWSTKLCLGFLFCCAFCCLWGWSIARRKAEPVAQYKAASVAQLNHNADMGWNVFFFSLQVTWAGIFGLGLAVPPSHPLQVTNNSAHLA